MSDDDVPPKTYSVAVRLRRTTVEEVHVRVPVTDDVVTDEIHPLQTPPPELGNGRTDGT